MSKHSKLNFTELDILLWFLDENRDELLECAREFDDFDKEFIDGIIVKLHRQFQKSL